MAAEDATAWACTQQLRRLNLFFTPLYGGWSTSLRGGSHGAVEIHAVDGLGAVGGTVGGGVVALQHEMDFPRGPYRVQFIGPEGDVQHSHVFKTRDALFQALPDAMFPSDTMLRNMLADVCGLPKSLRGGVSRVQPEVSPTRVRVEDRPSEAAAVSLGQLSMF